VERGRTGAADTEYQLGHEADELERLDIQGSALAPATHTLLNGAGLRAGMRVLDLGSGAGDVSFVVAELVGRIQPHWTPKGMFVADPGVLGADWLATDIGRNLAGSEPRRLVDSALLSAEFAGADGQSLAERLRGALAEVRGHGDQLVVSTPSLPFWASHGAPSIRAVLAVNLLLRFPGPLS